MSDLKISEAAKQLVASFVDDNAWNSLSEHWKETASRTAQGIINSEIDRIAGPLIHFIEDLKTDFYDYPVLMESTDRLLSNYRKERGE